MARHRLADMLLGLLILALASRAGAQPNPPKVLLRIEGSSLGHSGSLGHASFSPDGKSLATAAGFTDPSVCVWDLADGKPRYRKKLGEDDAWIGIALSADGKKLAALARKITFEADSTLYVWDVSTKTELLALPFGTWKIQRSAELVFSPDGNTLAVGGEGIRLLDVAAGKVRTKLATDDEVWGIAFHPAGRLLTASSKGIQFWDPVTGKQSGRLDAQDRWPVTLSPNGAFLALNSRGTVFVHRVTLPANVSKPVELGPARELAQFPRGQVFLGFSSDSRKLLASGHTDCREIEVATGKVLHRWSRPGEYVFGLAFRDDQPMVVTKQDSNAQALRLWDVAADKELLSGGHLQTVSALAFGPGDVLISAANDVRFWNARTGKMLARGDGDGWIAKLLLVPGDKEVAAIGDKVSWFSVPEGKKLRTFDPKPIPFGVRPALFSDGRTVAVPLIEFERSQGVGGGLEMRVRGAALIDVDKRQEVRRIAAVDQPYLCVSPDRSTLASFGYGVKFLDLREGTKLYESPDHSSVTGVCFSADGKFAAMCQFLTITVWEVSTRRPVRNWRLSQSEFVEGYWSIGPVLAFSPDGRLLAVGTPRGSVQLWDNQTGKCLTDVRGHTSSVCALAFRLDGHALASGGSDRTIVLWDLSDSQVSPKGSRMK